MAYKATDIQKALNKNGAGLSVDGIIGPKTTAAIKDFQKANGLQDDGIVGPKTWAALNKESTSGASAQTPAATAPAAPTWNYKESEGSQKKWSDYENFIATQKPGEYDKSWHATLMDTLDKINNREKFSYDLNGDMLYQQYKDQATTQGKLASMDAMGQIAAMTGGYGNSYAQTAGQQAYQGYLQQLNDKIPELYQLALSKYNQEGQDLYKQAGLLAQMDETAWNRNQADWNNFYKEAGMLFDNAKYMSETEYNQALKDFNAQYGAYRDDVADKQWQTSLDYKKEQDKIANDIAYKKIDASLSSKSSKPSSGPKYADFDYDVQTAWKADWEEALATGELGDLEDISDRMVQAGIDPITVADWFDDYAEKLNKKYKPKKMPNEFTDIYGKYSYSKN